MCLFQIEKAYHVWTDLHLSIFNPYFLFCHPPTIYPSILSIFVLSRGSSILVFCQRSDGRVAYVALSLSRWPTVGGENTQITANSYAYGKGLPSSTPSIIHSFHDHSFIHSNKQIPVRYLKKQKVDYGKKTLLNKYCVLVFVQITVN